MIPMNFSIMLVMAKHPLLNKDIRDNTGKSAFAYVNAFEFPRFYMQVYLELVPVVEQDE